LVGLGNGRQRRDVIGREEPGLAVEFARPPIGVELVDDVDDAALLEAELVRVLPLVLVQHHHLLHCSAATWIDKSKSNSHDYGVKHNKGA